MNFDFHSSHINKIIIINEDFFEKYHCIKAIGFLFYSVGSGVG